MQLFAEYELAKRGALANPIKLENAIHSAVSEDFLHSDVNENFILQVLSFPLDSVYFFLVIILFPFSCGLLLCLMKAL